MKVAVALAGIVLGSALAAPVSTNPTISASKSAHTHSHANFSLDSDIAAHALFGIGPDYRNEILKLHRFGHDKDARTILIRALEEKKAYKVIDKLEMHTSS